MIRFRGAILSMIYQWGEKSYPEECCGALFGYIEDGVRQMAEIFPLDNLHRSNREKRFLITPAQYLQAESAAGERQMQLLGFYHSHPDHPARPSPFDLQHAWPWFVYLIFSVDSGRAGQVSAWILDESRERFIRQEIIIQ